MFVFAASAGRRHRSVGRAGRACWDVRIHSLSVILLWSCRCWPKTTLKTTSLNVFKSRTKIFQFCQASVTNHQRIWNHSGKAPDLNPMNRVVWGTTSEDESYCVRVDRVRCGHHKWTLQKHCVISAIDAKMSFIQPNMTVTLWPPNNPDLNPVDYAVWRVLQETVYHCRSFKSAREL